jgi:NADH:ubiquinone oxidoreductase subunit D
MLRASGIYFDLRKSNPYDFYNKVGFSIPIGRFGDSYDRYLIRIEEMRQSIKIIQKCVNKLDSGVINSLYSKNLIYKDMTQLISHFKKYSSGFSLPKHQTYIATESPKGEFGVFLYSNGQNKTYRCKIKSPGLAHLQGLNKISKNLNLADLVTIIGTIDIVFGEIDR